MSHKNHRIKLLPPAEPHTGGRHIYDGVLPSAPERLFATLLSPPLRHAAFSMMPHTMLWWQEELAKEMINFAL
jgi:hypothetical protein